MGEPGRLARAIDNIIDNAISFSPPGGLVEVAATHVDDEIRSASTTRGPAFPQELREAIFNRFHSVRPKPKASAGIRDWAWRSPAQSSKAMTEEIDVTDRDDAPSGARFTITLKAADRA